MHFYRKHFLVTLCLMLLMFQGMGQNGCQIFLNSSNNAPSEGQQVSYSLTGCNSSCYSSCLSQNAFWTVTGPSGAMMIINGVSFTGSGNATGTNITAIFIDPGVYTILFSTNGNCSSACNGASSVSVTVGIPPVIPPSFPSTSLIPSFLPTLWSGAGADPSHWPGGVSKRECIDMRRDIKNGRV